MSATLIDTLDDASSAEICALVVGMNKRELIVSDRVRQRLEIGTERGFLRIDAEGCYALSLLGGRLIDESRVRLTNASIRAQLSGVSHGTLLHNGREIERSIRGAIELRDWDGSTKVLIDGNHVVTLNPIDIHRGGTFHIHAILSPETKAATR